MNTLPEHLRNYVIRRAVALLINQKRAYFLKVNWDIRWIIIVEEQCNVGYQRSAKALFKWKWDPVDAIIDLTVGY